MTRGPLSLDVAVSYACPRKGVPAAPSFRRWVGVALAGRIREADLAIRIVGEDEGRALNRHYRGKDYATNVLSFPAEPVMLGKDLPRPVNYGLVRILPDAATPTEPDLRPFIVVDPAELATIRFWMRTYCPAALLRKAASPRM